MTDRKIFEIKNPKFSEKGYSFSPDNNFMAMLDRKDGKDNLGIYICGDWKLIISFSLETLDAHDVIWSSNSRFLIVKDTLLKANLYFYSPFYGLISKVILDDDALGVKSL